MGEQYLFDETDVSQSVYTNGDVAELAQRQVLGEKPEDIIQSFKGRKETTLDLVKESSEISWLKSVGECESFLMASMSQHHVNLSQGRSAVLHALLDAIVDDSQVIDGLKASYEFFNRLVTDHEDRMNAFKEEWLERREKSKEQ